MSERLFDVGPDIVPARVGFLAGMLGGWTLGKQRPTAEQTEGFREIARDALERAQELAPTTSTEGG